MAAGMSKANGRQNTKHQAQYAAYASSNTQERNKVRKIIKHLRRRGLSLMKVDNAKFVSFYDSEAAKVTTEFAAINRIAGRVGMAKTRQFLELAGVKLS